MSELDSFPGHLIRRAQQTSVAIFQELTAHLDITQVQFAALIMLDGHPGIDQVTLAELIALDKATTGDVVIRMEKKGYLKRNVRPTDRRSFELHLTPAGEDLLGELRELTLKVRERIFSPLSPDERETLIRLLGKLADR